MTSALSVKMFADPPAGFIPHVNSIHYFSTVPKMFVLLAILVLGAVFWYGIASVGDQLTFQVTGYNAAFVEGIDPVLPEYYNGFGR